MSDSTDRDMERADIANGEGDPEQGSEARDSFSAGIVGEEEEKLPPLGQELEAD
jgi:hypothetical protein